jgi:hypothetical protein
MEQERIQYLINRVNEQTINDREQKELEQLIEAGIVDFTSFDQLMKVDNQLQKISFPSPSKGLDDGFYQMLASEKRLQPGFSWKNFFSWPELAPKLAFASVALLLGLAIGFFLRPSLKEDSQIAVLSNEVSDLKEMMMLSLLEKESATDRLKAVNLTQEMNGASSKVTSALIKTLNEDDNVNVRLAALEALKPYVRESRVREELIRSIARQQSPLVQVALADLMAAIQEKSSVNELQKIIQSKRTPAEVKNRIKESIKVLS